MAGLSLPPAVSGGILFLDIATAMGWAYGSPSDRILRSGTMLLPSYGENDAEMYDGVYTAVADLLEVYRPDVVAYEKALVTNWRDHRGEVQHVVSNDNVIDALRGGIAAARLAAWHVLRKTTLAYPSNTVRTVMRGFPAYDQKEKARDARGKLDYKPIVMAFCRHMGWTPPDHNAGDASVGAEYIARQHFGETFGRNGLV